MSFLRNGRLYEKMGEACNIFHTGSKLLRVGRMGSLIKAQKGL